MAEETARLLEESADERRRLSDLMSTVSVGVDPTQSDVDEVAALESELAALAAGIWSRPVPRHALLRDGDRVELYRPLRADPKESRRRRAERAARKPA